MKFIVLNKMTSFIFENYQFLRNLLKSVQILVKSFLLAKKRRRVICFKVRKKMQIQNYGLINITLNIKHPLPVSLTIIFYKIIFYNNYSVLFASLNLNKFFLKAEYRLRMRLGRGCFMFSVKFISP